MLRIILSLVTLTFFILNPALSIAADPPDEDTSTPLVFDMGQIHVTGSVLPEEPPAKTTITTETFDQNLEQSVVETVERAPGISVSTGSKNEPKIYMRGLAQERILVLYDGVPMAAPYYGDLDTSELPLENLSEVSILRGNSSVLFGANALGGVVSLISAKPSSKPNLNLLASVDQEGNFMARAAHGMRIGPWYYQVSAGVRDSDGWPMSDDFKPVYDSKGNLLEDGDIRDNSDYSQWSLGMKAGFEWETGELSVSGNYMDAEKGIPPTTDPNSKAQWWEFPTWKKSGIVLAGRQAAGDSMDFRANFFYHTYDNTLKNWKDAERTELNYQSTYDDFNMGGNFRFEWEASEQFVLRSALSAVLDNHKAQDNPGEPWSEYKAMTTTIGAEGEWRPLEVFTLQVGAGWEVYNFDTITNTSASSSSISTRAPDIDAPTFNLLASWRPIESHQISAAIGLRNRFPTMHQLFSNIEEFQPEDVDTLDPEKSMQYSLGYSFIRDAIELGASAFYYDVDDLIERPDRDALYENIQTATFSGIELWGGYQPKTGPQGLFNYTFLDAKNKTSGQPEQDLAYTPEHTVRLDAGYAFEFGTTLLANLTYRDNVIQYDRDGNPLDVPSYSIYGLQILHTFDFGLSLNVKADNLLDEDYYQEIGFEQPGRVISFGVQYKL